MRIKQVNPSSLTPYANNAKNHSEEQVEALKVSIESFGFNNPILIDEKKVIIAGHGRHQAALQLGLTKVPTITLEHLSEAKRRAYILADNILVADSLGLYF